MLLMSMSPPPTELNTAKNSIQKSAVQMVTYTHRRNDDDTTAAAAAAATTTTTPTTTTMVMVTMS